MAIKILKQMFSLLGLAVPWTHVQIWWNGIWAGCHKGSAAGPQQWSRQGFRGPDGSRCGKLSHESQLTQSPTQGLPPTTTHRSPFPSAFPLTPCPALALVVEGTAGRQLYFSLSIVSQHFKMDDSGGGSSVTIPHGGVFFLFCFFL